MKAGIVFLVATALLSAGVSALESSALFFNENQANFRKTWNNLVAEEPQKPEQEQDKAIVLIEYAVPPPVQARFVELFGKLQEATKSQARGVKEFGLSRTVDENLTFYLYSEWDDLKAYAEQSKSDYVKAYLEEIAKLSVVWKLHVLKSISYTK